jgi:hypothetical protein
VTDSERITAYAELCQIFALLQVRSDRTAGPQARHGRTKRCEEPEIGPIGPLGGRTPGSLLVTRPKPDGPKRTIFDVWCSDAWLAKYILEDYVKKTNHKRFYINDFYAALFITSGFP